MFGCFEYNRSVSEIQSIRHKETFAPHVRLDFSTDARAISGGNWGDRIHDDRCVLSPLKLNNAKCLRSITDLLMSTSSQCVCVRVCKEWLGYTTAIDTMFGSHCVPLSECV